MLQELIVVFAIHDDDGKALDGASLDQRQGFEELIESAESAGHDDKAVGVLEQEDFANEEVAYVDGSIEIGVGFLFEGQFDVDTHTSSADIFRPAVGGFHDSRTAAGHDRESQLCEFPCDLSGEGVIGITLSQASRTEDSDARADEMELAKPLDELPGNLEREEQFAQPRLSSFQKLNLALVQLHSVLFFLFKKMDCSKALDVAMLGRRAGLQGVSNPVGRAAEVAMVRAW